MKIQAKEPLLIDMQYVRGNKKENIPDYLYVIYKDQADGKKYVEKVPEPRMDIYFEKPEFRNHDYNKTFEKQEHLNKYNCKYTDIKFAIAQDMGDRGKRFLEDVFATKNYSRLRDLNRWPYVFGHDFDIITYYRNAWYKTVQAPIHKDLSIAFLDIETDSFDHSGFSNPETCPVDMITVIDEKSMSSYTFALQNQEYKMRDVSHLNPEEAKKIREYDEYHYKMHQSRIQQENALKNDLDGLKEELHQMFDETYGEIDYNFYFYEDERKMLVHLFQLIHKISPDFMLIWNISFDIPYLIDRMKILGLDPEEIICDAEFPTKVCRFQKDTRNFEVKNRSDYFHCSSKTVYYDQMILYAAKRKGQAELRSNKLTYIAQKEIGDEKLDYSEEGDFKRFPYLNYRKYFIYNIKDVLLQLGINRKTQDTETLYISSYENLTQYKDVWKQTVVLRNVQYKFHLSHGFVPGANINKLDAYDNSERLDDEEEDGVGYEGALVGNPLLIDNFGEEMYGKQTDYLFTFSIDMDMSAFYPNTNYELNIDASTLIFKVIVDPKQYDCNGGDIPFKGITNVQMIKTNSPSWTDDMAKEIFDNFQSKNYLSLGYKFMNLPSVVEIEKELAKEMG